MNTNVYTAAMNTAMEDELHHMEEMRYIEDEKKMYRRERCVGREAMWRKQYIKHMWNRRKYVQRKICEIEGRMLCR